MVCVAQNDALLEGLLTLIHKEREAEFHMSSMQVWRLALPQRLKVLFTRPARRSTALTLSRWQDHRCPACGSAAPALQPQGHGPGLEHASLPVVGMLALVLCGAQVLCLLPL